MPEITLLVERVKIKGNSIAPTVTALFSLSTLSGFVLNLCSQLRLELRLFHMRIKKIHTTMRQLSLSELFGLP